MIKISNPSQCSGCTACASICAHNAISMVPDGLGFKSPEVNAEKCVNCGLCIKVCPFKPDYDTSGNFAEPKAVAVRLLDGDRLALSQSGGAFTALTDAVIANGGVVYGVGMDSAFRAVHKRARTHAERDEMRGSKYVQSSLDGIFRQVKADLLAGLTVVFSGTPCQVAGLKAYIHKRLREHLYLIDLICHGTPSPAIWSDYLLWLECEHNDSIVAAKFRDKSIGGWRVPRESYAFSRGEKVVADSYTFLFYQHIDLRESCFDCKFCNTRRPSDITIGDFWGVENLDPELSSDGKGLSIVLVNSPKGETLLNLALPEVIHFNVPIEATLQPNLCAPSSRPANRSDFERDYIAHGFKYVFFKYGKDGWRHKLRCAARSIYLFPYRAIRRLVKIILRK